MGLFYLIGRQVFRLDCEPINHVRDESFCGCGVVSAVRVDINIHMNALGLGLMQKTFCLGIKVEFIFFAIGQIHVKHAIFDVIKVEHFSRVYRRDFRDDIWVFETEQIGLDIFRLDEKEAKELTHSHVALGEIGAKLGESRAKVAHVGTLVIHVTEIQRGGNATDIFEKLIMFDAKMVGSCPTHGSACHAMGFPFRADEVILGQKAQQILHDVVFIISRIAVDEETARWNQFEAFIQAAIRGCNNHRGKFA